MRMGLVDKLLNKILMLINIMTIMEIQNKGKISLNPNIAIMIKISKIINKIYKNRSKNIININIKGSLKARIKVKYKIINNIRQMANIQHRFMINKTINLIIMVHCCMSRESRSMTAYKNKINKNTNNSKNISLKMSKFIKQNSILVNISTRNM